MRLWIRARRQKISERLLAGKRSLSGCCSQIFGSLAAEKSASKYCGRSGRSSTSFPFKIGWRSKSTVRALYGESSTELAIAVNQLKAHCFEFNIAERLRGSAGCQPALVGSLPTRSYSASCRTPQASCLRSAEGSTGAMPVRPTAKMAVLLFLPLRAAE